MNYLAIVQRLHEKSGLSGSAPATVVGQTGMFLRLVNWASQAWDELQAEREDWRFLWAQGTETLVSGTRTYDLTANTPTYDRLDEDMVTTISPTDANDIQPIEKVDFDEFIVNHERGHTATGRPGHYACAPDGRIHLSPIPDAAYTLAFDYWRTPQALTENSDTPLLPAKYHMAIVYRALMLYGAFDEATGTYGDALREYERFKRRIMATEGPRIKLGEALDAY